MLRSMGPLVSRSRYDSLPARPPGAAHTGAGSECPSTFPVTPTVVTNTTPTRPAALLGRER